MPHIPVQEILDFLRSFYDQYGYPVVFISALIENTALVGFILPGNSLVLLGAVYARLGSLNLGLVILFATLGTIVGYHLDYLFGRFFLGSIAGRLNHSVWGRRLRLAGRLRLARMLLSKHGGKAILLSHLVGSLRSIIAIAAGFTRMSYSKFLFYEVLAATLWTTMYACLGYFIAVNIDRLAAIIQQVGLVLFFIVLALYLAWRYFSPEGRKKRLRAQRLQERKAKRALTPSKTA